MDRALIYPLLAATIVPYVFTVIAKAGAFGPKDNHRTRDWFGEQEGFRKRAHWAQLNSFEVLPMFVAGLLAAATTAGPTTIVISAAWGFIGLRLLYGAMYIANQARLRTLTFFANIACVAVLFAEAIRA